MLSFSARARVFVAVEPCDLRRGFNGLHDLVSGTLGEDPKSGAIFAFINRKRTLLKLLYWGGSGKRSVKRRVNDIARQSSGLHLGRLHLRRPDVATVAES